MKAKATCQTAVILFIIAVSTCFAAEVNWKTTNQATIAWDPVTTFMDNAPLPAGTAVQYKVYSRAENIPTTGPIQELTTVTAAQAVITFTEEGRYFIGIKAQRLVSGTLIPESDSTIAWSDSAPATQGGLPFGVAYFKKLKDPGGIR